MSASNYFEEVLLKLIFNGTTISNIADDASSSPATEFWISLHTSDPDESGGQNTNEANYTSYARVSVNRTTSGWSITNNVASNVGAIQFPTATGGSSTVTHFGIGLSQNGSGTLLYSGALDASLAVTNGITPSFQAGDLTVTLD